MEEMNNLDAIRQKRLERTKKKNRTKLIFVVVSIIAIVGIVFALIPSDAVPEKDGTVIGFEIKQGESAKTIAANLKKAGLINNTGSFINALKKSEYANSLKFGVYTIEKGTDIDGIINILAKGGNVKDGITVTIPEGFSVEKIIERLVESGISNREDLIKAANASYDYNFLNTVPDSNVKYKLQGFLFPSTYVFTKDMTATEVFDTMLNEFDKQIKNAGISSADIYKTVTLASLVEREAKIKSEQKTIAGVIENRINKGMRLQIDASVVYAISDGLYNVDKVLYKDLEVDSLYNTYKYSGLPVGPICSPGIDAIKAATEPSKHNYYYYRVDESKNDGSHTFTENFEEHKNVAN